MISGLILLAGCGESPAPQSAGQTRAIEVHAVAAVAERWPSVYEAVGTVRARTSATIAAKWMGYVREVKVQAGDRVRQGQLLVVLDARDLDAGASRAAAARDAVRNGIGEADSAIAAAKATLDLAQSTFRRMSELYEKKSISDQEFDEASARQKAAQAAFEMAKAKRATLDARLAEADDALSAAKVSRSYAEIQAPFAGIVTSKSVDPGNLAVPGAPLVTIERDGYRLEASVEESRLSRIRLEQAVAVTLDGFDGAIDARVSEIVPAVDAASRTAIVKIDLPERTGLRSGIFGRARFQLGSRQALAIPFTAVTERGQLQSVFVAGDGLARTRLVTLGERLGDKVEVLSGLAAGETVILPGAEAVSDGARVEVAR